MDTFIFAVIAIVLFAAVCLVFAPDSRDARGAMDRYGSWATLGA